MSTIALAPSTTRIRRKPVPKFDITSRYPEPDPEDPLAPLSVLRSRHQLDSTPFPSSLSPLASGTAAYEVNALTGRRSLQQSSSFDDVQWQRCTVNTIKPFTYNSRITTSDPATAPRLDFPEYRLVGQPGASVSAESLVTRGRTERRKRARSVAVSPNSPHASHGLPPPLPIKSEARKSLAPSPAPSASSSSGHRTAPFSAHNRSSVSAQFADFTDYPLHLLHTLGRDSFSTDSSGDDCPPSIVKPMRIIDVDMPAPHMTREASSLSSASLPGRQQAGQHEHDLTRGRPAKTKGSRLSIFSRGRSRSSSLAMVPSLPIAHGHSTSSADTDSGYMTAATTPSPPSSASSAVSMSRRSSSNGRDVPHKRRLSTVYAGDTPDLDAFSDAGLLASQRARAPKRTQKKSSSANSLRSKISLPVSQPVPIPFTFGSTGTGDGMHRAQLESTVSVPRTELRATAPVSSQLHILSTVPPISRSESQAPQQSSPTRPQRSHLRSTSNLHMRTSPGSHVDSRPLPDVPALSNHQTTSLMAPPPPQDTPGRGLSNYQPGARSPPPPPRPMSPLERPMPQTLPKLAPIVTPSTRKAPHTAKPVFQVHSAPMSRRRTSSLLCDRDFTSSPVSPKDTSWHAPPVTRTQTAPTLKSHKHAHAGIAVSTLPSAAQLAAAAQMAVYRENGTAIRFGEIWKARRTVVVFIRYFWCPSCQDYLASVMREVDHALLQHSGIQLVVVGCGPFNLIKSYRHIFRLPYSLFVDPTPDLQLYSTLGMGTLDHVHSISRSDKVKGHYVRHGPVRGLAMVWKNALRTGMPVWTNGGDSSQLGGEFVLGPGLTCTYAHRMLHTRGHAPILEVLMAAGVDASRSSRVRFPSRESSDSESSLTSGTDQEETHIRPGMRRGVARPGAGVVSSTESRRSIGWDSDLSNESGVLIYAH